MRAARWIDPREGARVFAPVAASGDQGTGTGRSLAAAAVLLRFAISGDAVAAVQLGVVTALTVSGMPIQAALAIGYALALTLHFTLNRRWVFATGRGFAHRFTAQGIRYLCVALGSYSLTALALAVLPGALAAPELAVFLGVSITLGLAGFLMMRVWVFRQAATS